MIKKLAIGLLCALMNWSSAEACSVWNENRKGEFVFDAISPYVSNKNWSAFDDDALAGLVKAQVSFDDILFSDSIYIGKAKLKNTKITLSEYEKHPLQILKFQVSETIMGDEKDFVWYSEDGKNITPILTRDYKVDGQPYGKGFQDTTDEMIASHNTFKFWDTQIVPKSTLTDPYYMTSCGFRELPQVSLSSTYIIFEEEGEVKYFPVASQNDPYVKILKNAITNDTRMKISMPVENYFRHMSNALPVRLVCKGSMINANVGVDWWDPFTSFPLHSDEKKVGASFERLSPDRHQKTDAEKILEPNKIDLLDADWPAIFAYYGDRNTNLLTCNENEEYLVFEPNYGPVHSSDVNIKNGEWVSVPKYRFAKIENGEIISASIHTNIALTGPSRIPIKSVLKWIDEGNPKPLDFNTP